jgi:hypothetical protein
MTQSHHLTMPDGFTKRIHKALRAWHKQHGENVLVDLLLAHRIRTTLDTASPRLITNQVLIEGLDLLKEVNAEAYDLIQRRFLNKETAREVAYSLNVSPDVVYQRQRAAIQQLAQFIWAQEARLRQKQAQRVARRLEPPTYTRLFGIEEKITDVRTILEQDAAPWMLALEGTGGMGKTSLADALVRHLAYGTHFQEIGWVSARRRMFRLPGSIETLPPCPTLTFTEMVDRLIEQFELTNLKRQSDREKQAGLKAYLNARRCLIVLDNLETLPDHHALIARLRELTDPAKFLITTRHSLRGESGVYILRLGGLSREDTFRLIRYEAETQGLTELAQAPEAVLAPIYTLTGGNPLATKLIVGQTHTFALSTVLDRLQTQEQRPVRELLDFIYKDAWHALTPDQRKVMQALLLVPDEGGKIEQIAAASDLSIGETAACLSRLATLSLLTVNGGLDKRRYVLHELTQEFVAQQTTLGSCS